MQNIKVFLPDKSVVELPEGSVVFDVAKAIGPGLLKASLAAKINGVKVDLSHTVSNGDKVEIITFKSDDGPEVYWHSTSHLLAMAVKQLWPKTKLAIGPAIEKGFYYDFDTERPFVPEDLPKIEKKMIELSKLAIPFKKEDVSRDKALELFKGMDEDYKLELVDSADGGISLYKNGDFVDLCRGPHVPNTSYIKRFKLTSIAGAYWRGDEKNKMLQRIYGISFPDKKDLAKHLLFLEEAEKRDHRRIGKDLDLFSFHKEGQGFPFWHPKGMSLYNSVVAFLQEKLDEAGYGEIKTPVILNEELWHLSGHWDKYKENMYFTKIDGKDHAIKPMNCPGGLLVYKTHQYSYRDLPVRTAELGLVHRHEKAGVLHGLFRVRQFTQDDAHVFCLPSQIESEINGIIDMIEEIYGAFGFDKYEIELSTRPEKSIGSDEDWQRAEDALKSVLQKRNIGYKLNPGDGAFYGPKIDFHIRDSLNRLWQCGTIQLDFSMPERFKLEYIDSDQSRKRPVMIHRAIMGSIERFIGILIENYGGAFPLWLAPVQVAVLPISENFLEYANEINDKLKKSGIRSIVDARNEKIGAKIRNCEVQKIIYMAIVGQKEVENGQISLRKHREGDKGVFDFELWHKELIDEIKKRSA